MTSNDPVPPAIREFNDRGVKWLLESPDNAEALLAVVAPDLAPLLNFSQARLEPTSQIADSLRKQEADVIFSVPLRKPRRGAPAEVRVYLLIEHQSTPDRLILLRVLFYMVGVWQQQYREWLLRKGRRQKLKLVPFIPLVFYTGAAPWGRPLSLAELMNLPPELARFVPTSEVLFLNLKETPAETLVAGGHPLGWLLRVMQKAEGNAGELEAALGESLEQLGRLPTEQRGVLGKLLRFLMMLVYYKREPGEARELAERVDAVAREAKVEEMGRTFYQEAVEEGRREGRQDGLEAARTMASG